MRYVDMRTKAIAVCAALDPNATWAQTDRIQEILDQLRQDALGEALDACREIDGIREGEWQEGLRAAIVAIERARSQSFKPR